MTSGGRGDGARAVTTGLFMIAAGVLLILDQQGVVEIGSVGSWWPLLLVALGLWKATAPRGERDAGEAAMLILLGGWLLGCVHHWLGLTYRNSWPLIFVAIGAKMTLRALAPRAPGAGASGAEEVPHA